MKKKCNKQNYPDSTLIQKISTWQVQENQGTPKINLSSPLQYKQLRHTLHLKERNDQISNATNPSKTPQMFFLPAVRIKYRKQYQNRKTVAPLPSSG